MSVTPIRDRKAERRADTRAEILAAAWEIAHTEGLAQVSLREIGARVGMRAQSLYSYFDSKHAIYDAMFREGNEELLRRMEVAAAAGGGAEPAFRRATREFVAFAVENPTRSQLLFVRTIPGYEPSPEAYAPAVRTLELTAEALGRLGITGPEMLDIWTAVLSGLIHQQLANDPGGDRWTRHVDDVIDMYLAYAKPKKHR